MARTPTYKLKAIKSGLGLLQRVSPKLAAGLAFELFLRPIHRPATAAQHQILNRATPIHIRHGNDTLGGYIWDNDGPTVLLVHGWEGSAGSMTGLVAPLLTAGYRVVAFDGPAHGISQAKQTHMVDYGRALRATLEQVGPVYAIIGHSFGGATTVMSASEGLPVERLVILAAPARLTDMIKTFCAMWGLSPQVAQHFGGLVRRRVNKPAEYFSIDIAARRLTQHGLVVHDRRDPLVAFADSEALVANWKHAELLATEGLGHRGICQNEAVLDEIVGFLAEEVTVALALPY